MNARRLSPLTARAISILAALAMLLSLPTAASAASNSPFVGKWQTTDPDGSVMTLIIAGRVAGPFQLTLTDTYFGLCEGGPGIGRGTALLNPDDTSLLEVDVHVECFNSDTVLDYRDTFQYHAGSDTLTEKRGTGAPIIWSREGRPQPTPAPFNLRVNYGHDWVESFYEAGHTVWVTLADADGNAKAMLEAFTEPKGYWGGEPGFTSLDSGWLDLDGNPMENPPDIQTNDWVFGWVDNGASAEVQIGKIVGEIDLAVNTITGTVLTSWPDEQVRVECLDWGSGAEPPLPTDEFGWMGANGSDTYVCSWEEWDIQPGQTVGVGYFDGSGNWVANAFRSPYLTVFPEQDALEAWEWPDGATIDASVANEPQCTTQGTAGYSPDNPWSTFMWLDFPDDCDLVAGNAITLSDGTITLTHVIQNLAITNVDRDADTVSGTANTGAEVYAWVHGYGETEQQLTVADDAWIADFAAAGFDIVEGMCGRAEIRDEGGNRTAVDWCSPRPRITAFLDQRAVEGYDWPIDTRITATVQGKDQCFAEATAAQSGDAFWTTAAWMSFPEGCDLAAGDTLTVSGGETSITYTLRDITIEKVDPVENLISGTVSPGEGIHTWVHEYYEASYMELPAGDGAWSFDFDTVGFDIAEGMCGRVETTDEATNSTAVDWCIPVPPTPAFYAVPDEEVIFTSGWTPGGTLVVSINGDVVASQPVIDASEIKFDLNGLWDIQAGNVITLTDGSATKELIVDSVHVTGFDLATHTIFGVSDPGELFVGVNGEEVWTTVGDDGNWRVSSPGFEPLAWGSAIKTDGDGDQTRDIFMIPRPMMYAFAEENLVEGTVWFEGQGVTLTVYEAETENNVYENTITVPAPDQVPWTAIEFNVGATGYDLKPGDRLVMEQNGYRRELILSPLQITGWDSEAHTIWGTGQPETSFLIRINGLDITSTVDGNGNWSVEHPNLVSGVWGEAIQMDDDGDETRDGFQVQ